MSEFKKRYIGRRPAYPQLHGFSKFNLIAFCNQQLEKGSCTKSDIK